MIEKRLTKSEFIKTNQNDWLRILRRSINIIYFDYIMRVPGSLGIKLVDGVIVSGANRIRVANALFDDLDEWLKKGIDMLRNTSDRPLFDNGQTNEMIRIYDEGNIYF